MAYLQLQTGKTVYISTFNFLFKTENGKIVPTTDEEIAEFFQACIADDLGEFMENPFSNLGSTGTIRMEEDEIPEELELPEDELDIDEDKL